MKRLPGAPSSRRPPQSVPQLKEALGAGQGVGVGGLFLLRSRWMMHWTPETAPSRGLEENRTQSYHRPRGRRGFREEPQVRVWALVLEASRANGKNRTGTLPASLPPRAGGPLSSLRGLGWQGAGLRERVVAAVSSHLPSQESAFSPKLLRTNPATLPPCLRAGNTLRSWGPLDEETL